MKFSLRQLQVFVATAHSQNISQAATELKMSQSAASSALKELEQQFDIQLFDRVGKRLQLNELGQTLRPQAQALLDQAAQLDNALRQHSQVGNIKVGATLTIGNYLAVPIMAQFKLDNPDAKVDLDVQNTAAIAHKVANFELDVGLIEGELRHADLEVMPWCEDELVCFCAPNHPYARSKRLSDRQLLAADWVVREPGSGTRQTFDRAMQGLLPQLNLSLELQHTEAIKHAVEAGFGIGCLSKVALEEAFAHQRFIALNTPQRNFKRQFYFIVHQHKYRSAGIEAWLALCRKLYQ